MSADEAGQRPRILLFGGNGQIGWELVRALAPLGEVVAPPRDELALDDADAIASAVPAVAPALIVNAAAFTDVDGAESQEATAEALNARAPGLLAQEAAKLGIAIVHFSTDYVFDGKARHPYTETDRPAPLNAYGRSKLAGETAVADSGAAHLILRSSWIYSRRGKNFLRAMQRLAGEQDELRVVADQTGCPTWARMLAEGTAAILARCWNPASSDPLLGTSGLYHLAAGGETSWHGFAEAIVAALPGDLAKTPVKAVTTADMPRHAKRPAYSVLDCAKAEDAFGIRLPHWREQLRLCLAD